MPPDTPDEGVRDEEGVMDDEEVTTEELSKKLSVFEKQLKDKEDHIRKLQSDLDKTKSDEGKLNDILSELTKNVVANKVDDPDPDDQVQDFAEKVASTLDDDPKTAVSQILYAVSGWIKQSEESASKARETAIKALADEVGMTVKELKKKLGDQDPEMLEYGEAAKRLAETAGLDFEENRDAFIKLAKSEGLSNKRERHQLPGGFTSTSVLNDDGEVAISPYEQMAGFGKLPKDVQKRLKAKWKKEVS